MPWISLPFQLLQHGLVSPLQLSLFATRLIDPTNNDALRIVTGCLRPTPAYNLPTRAVASGGARGVRPPIWNMCPPISRLAPRLLHTSQSVFLKCGPPFWVLAPPSDFCPPLLLNPGNGPASKPRRHPTCWASSQWSHTVSSTRCHIAWTSAPLSAHHRVQTHGVSNWNTHLYPPHNISSVYLTTTTYVRRGGRITNGIGTRSGRTVPQDSAFSSPIPAPNPRKDPPSKSLGPAQPPPYRCRTFPLLLVQMGYGLPCSLWVWHRRTNRRPYCPPLFTPSTSQWTAWPNGAGRWDNPIVVQHLTRDLERLSSGFNISLKRRRSLLVDSVLHQNQKFDKNGWNVNVTTLKVFESLKVSVTFNLLFGHTRKFYNKVKVNLVDSRYVVCTFDPILLSKLWNQQWYWCDRRTGHVGLVMLV